MDTVTWKAGFVHRAIACVTISNHIDSHTMEALVTSFMSCLSRETDRQPNKSVV